MSHYWKILGLRRAPATHRVLEQAYNSRLESLIRRDDVDGIAALHAVRQEGKAALDAIASSVATPAPAPTSKETRKRKSAKKDDGLSLDDFMPPPSKVKPKPKPAPVAKPTPKAAPKPQRHRVVSETQIGGQSHKDTSRSNRPYKIKPKSRNKDVWRKFIKESRTAKKRHDENPNASENSLGGAVLSFYRRYFDFSGRSRRSDFWFMFLLQAIFFTGVLICLADYLEALNQAFDVETDVLPPVADYGVLASRALFAGLIVYCVNFIPNIALWVRMFHDRDKSGWLYALCMVLMFVPLLGNLLIFALLIVFARRGTDGPNRYGEDPLDS